MGNVLQFRPKDAPEENLASVVSNGVHSSILAVAGLDRKDIADHVGKSTAEQIEKLRESFAFALSPEIVALNESELEGARKMFEAVDRLIREHLEKAFHDTRLGLLRVAHDSATYTAAMLMLR